MVDQGFPNGTETTDVLRLERHVDGGTIRLGAIGEVDATTAPAITEAVTTAVKSGVRRVVVDLEKVTFMDSSGIRGLLTARDVAGDALRLGPLSESVKRILDLSGLQGQFAMADDDTT